MKKNFLYNVLLLIGWGMFLPFIGIAGGICANTIPVIRGILEIVGCMIISKICFYNAIKVVNK